MTDRRGEYERWTLGRRARSRGYWAAAAFALAWCGAACGSDDDDDSAPTDSGGDCPSIAGSWTITMHCGTSLVGSKVTITQEECQVSTGGAFAGLSGHLAADGSFMLSGTQNGMSVSCGGVATPTSITETCNESCVVALSR